MMDLMAGAVLAGSVSSRDRVLLIVRCVFVNFNESMMTLSSTWSHVSTAV